MYMSLNIENKKNILIKISFILIKEPKQVPSQWSSFLT